MMCLRTDRRTDGRHADCYIPRTYRSGDKKSKLTNHISWVPGHADTKGNEDQLVTDTEEAKDQGDLSVVRDVMAAARDSGNKQEALGSQRSPELTAAS